MQRRYTYLYVATAHKVYACIYIYIPPLTLRGFLISKMTKITPPGIPIIATTPPITIPAIAPPERSLLLPVIK